VLTTRPFWVQWTKLWPPLGVAVTVCDVPATNVPPPPIVPSALGEALTVIVYSLGLTVRVATRLVLPWPVDALVKAMLPT
jgi:hypothetical protein